HLDGVLVVAHQEPHVVPLLAAVAGLDVGADFLERGADVRPAVRVIDGGGQKETRSCGHDGGSSFGQRLIHQALSYQRMIRSSGFTVKVFPMTGPGVCRSAAVLTCSMRLSPPS